MDSIATLGYIFAAKLAWSLLLFLKDLAGGLGLLGAVDVKKLGSWAVVTGATDGIGKGVAMQLAKRGVSVLLVSRTQQRLDDTAAEIKAACPSVETATLQFDFSSATEADYARLAKAVVGKDIGVLYNNVGISYSYAQFLEQLPDDRVDAIVEMNMRAMVKCTKLVLPGMLEKKEGAIVNIGSAAGTIPDPLYSVYSGSKAFVEFFSASMAAELGGRSGITCQDHIPFFVATKLAKIRKPSLFAPSADSWATASLNTIGGASVVVPYWTHQIQAAALGLVPTVLWNKYKYGFGVGIRKRGMKKEEDAKSK